MNKLTRKTKLIIEYGRFVDLMKDIQEDAIMTGGDDDYLNINIKRDIEKIIKYYEVQIIK
jgi:hypothetical protein